MKEKYLDSTVSVKAHSVSAHQDHSISRLSAGESALIGIFILLFLFVLKYAAVILVPITLAILLSLLFTPIVHFLSFRHIPKPVGAAIVVTVLIACFVGSIAFLAEPFEEWLDKSPQLLQKIETRIKKIKEPIQQVQKAAEKVEKLTNMNSSNQLAVKSGTKNLFETFFSATPGFLASLVLSTVLLYFLLFKGKPLAKYVIKFIFWLAHQRTDVDVGHSIQQEISSYLLTITVINTLLGVIVTIVLALIGLPNAMLWGTMVALLNFAPYVGAVISMVVITVISFVTFESLPYIFMAPAAFLLITALEGQFITPQILGSRFSMNPLVIFLSIILWSWLWGYVGALIAFPLLVSTKVLCQSVDVLKPFAEFLEDNGKTTDDKQ